METVEKKRLGEIINYQNKPYKIIGITGGKDKPSVITLYSAEEASTLLVPLNEFKNAK